MKYHFLAAGNPAPDLGVLFSFHEGRTFISEGEILSWFKDLDTGCDGSRTETCGIECDGAGL